MNFCSHCAAPVVWQIPFGDTVPRFMCPSCGMVHYQNPKVVTACIVEWHDQILLCKRAIEPRRGLWTLPGGFMENHETVEQGAARETWEEALARVHDMSLFMLISLPHISQIFMVFRAQLDALEFAPGPESLATELFTEADIPWDQLAFAVVTRTLRQYYEDKTNRAWRVHVDQFTPPPRPAP